MPHWFDGGLAYPWSEPAAQKMYDTLVVTISEPNNIDRYYRMSIEGVVAPLNQQNPVDVLWKQALDDVATAGGLARLCNKLQVGRRWPKLRSAAAALLELRPATKKVILSRDVLVLDRERLRELVVELQSDSQAGVVVVRGDQQTGKTYSKHIFLAAAKDRGAQGVWLFPGLIATVRQAIAELFAAYGESPPPPEEGTDSTPTAVYKTVCTELMKVAVTKRRALWIAVDGLGFDSDGARVLDEEILNFFNVFALHLANPPYRQWFRLMLIQYPEGQLPTQWPEELWREDRPTECDVGLEDIAEGIREWSKSNKDATYEQANELAAGIIASVDALPAGGRLRRINDELKRTLKDLGSSGS
jgi:hypothetical protein